MKEVKPKADFLIEICVQIVNNISGVYTVLTSKAQEMKRYYGENFYMVGPYYKKSADIEFEEQTPSKEIKNLIEELKKDKIICHYGRWLISGSPKTFLINPPEKLDKLNVIIRNLKTKYSIDLSELGYKEKNSIIKDSKFKLLWGDSVNIFIKRLLSLQEFNEKKGVLQFHYSDPSAMLVADLKRMNYKIGLVATAHSTRLGRAIAFNKEDLFKEIKLANKKKKKISNKREYSYGGKITYLHKVESLLTKNVDVLTSVSDIVATETEYILGRKPDIITPNGLDMDEFPSLEERAILHRNSKERLYRFLNAYFLPYYQVDVPHSLLFFTSGRYELITKGYDILLDALCKLNEKLKKENYQNNIFVFLFIMASVKKANEAILQNQAIYDVIEHSVKEEMPHLEKRIISNLIHGNKIKKEVLFDEHFLLESKKLMLKFKRKKFENPPIVGFKGLKKDDTIIKLLLKCGLDNKEDDKVKIIFYPAPVSVADGLLSMEYHEVISGTHLGIFPSMYEPWGYTPLETAAHGVMSITSDVAGFGKFIIKNSDQRKKPGILVLRIEGKKRDEIVNELTKLMYWVSHLPQKKRIEKKLEAKKLSTLADWKEFAKYYIKAHNLAIERCKARVKTKK